MRQEFFDSEGLPKKAAARFYLHVVNRLIFVVPHRQYEGYVRTNVTRNVQDIHSLLVAQRRVQQDRGQSRGMLTQRPQPFLGILSD